MLNYLPEYASIDSLKSRAAKRMPQFAFEYLDGGCNEDINLYRNTAELREIVLDPKYLSDIQSPSMKTSLFGVEYTAPFGISPIGLQGLIWPGASEILAKAAFDANVPFILSTVATSSIEKIGDITEGKAWFQLYHPTDEVITDDLLVRAERSGYKVLVLLADVPQFGFRHRDMKNGLAMPPRMTASNLFQMATHPAWLTNTLRSGIPSFASLEKYFPSNLNLKKMGEFMNETFTGVLNEEKVARLREKWKGKLVIKGLVNLNDIKKVVELGLDGVIVSNHGGRQLDAGESTINSLKRIAEVYGDKITMMMDSGIRSGVDIGRTLACGAEFTFLGRTFMYGVGALGKQGGDHTINLLKAQLLQLMDQLRCEKISDFPNHLLSYGGEKSSFTSTSSFSNKKVASKETLLDLKKAFKDSLMTKLKLKDSTTTKKEANPNKKLSSKTTKVKTKSRNKPKKQT